LVGDSKVFLVADFVSNFNHGRHEFSIDIRSVDVSVDSGSDFHGRLHALDVATR